MLIRSKKSRHTRPTLAALRCLHVQYALQFKVKVLTHWTLQSRALAYIQDIIHPIILHQLVTSINCPGASILWLFVSPPPPRGIFAYNHIIIMSFVRLHILNFNLSSHQLLFWCSLILLETTLCLCAVKVVVNKMSLFINPPTVFACQQQNAWMM